MDIAAALRTLLQRPVLPLIGILLAIVASLFVAFRVSLTPPSIDAKNLVLHVADTSVLIDRPNPALVDLQADLRPLADRADVFARYMLSQPVRQAIARRAGLDENRIAFEAPLELNAPKAAQEPVAVERSQQIFDEEVSHGIRFTTDSGLPTVTMTTRAPSLQEALDLADAAAKGFGDYVRREQERANIPPERRVTVRQLGRATGGSGGQSVGISSVIVTFLAVFIGWCLLSLLGLDVARGWRRLDELERGG